MHSLKKDPDREERNDKQKKAIHSLPGMKKRFRHFLVNVAEIISVGLVYYLLILIFKVSLPCPIYALTGKYCPGCGISRMCMALFRLDFHTAYLSNRFLFVLSPFLILYFFWKEYIYIRYDKMTTGKIETLVIFLVAIAAIAFAVLRNTEAFSYWQPIA